MSIEEIEIFFKSVTLPQSILLEDGSEIPNVRRFVDRNLNFFYKHRDQAVSKLVYNKLMLLKDTLASSHLEDRSF